MNAGSISPDVAGAVRDGIVPLWIIEANVRFVDGPTLLSLFQSAAYNRGMLYESNSQGLLLNYGQTKNSLLRDLGEALCKCVSEEGPYPALRCHLAAVAGYCERPINATMLPFHAIERY